jgi:tRNA-uridine 2-sulfurtransferase
MEDMNKQQHVYVALSGGVDSAVTAVRLLDQGFQVTGIFMETWKDPRWEMATRDSQPAASIAADAAAAIGIPFVSLDVRDVFYQRVVRSFIEQYARGMTPNPCLFCNPQVKWGILQTYAIEQGADYFATGHYARIVRQHDGRVRLLRGIDRTKDQSYVLAMLSQSQLRQSLLPLGDLTKVEVRNQAKALNLPVADRQDSQDLCFLGDIDYRDFLQHYAPDSASPGEIVNVQGKVLGEHHGLAFYTIGQRRGIQIAAPEPYYVIDKDTSNNRLVVGFTDQAKKGYLWSIHPNWISGEPPEPGELIEVMIRYRAQPVAAQLIDSSSDGFRLKLSQPLRGITPGQVAVLLQGEVCLGGGMIESAW